MTRQGEMRERTPGTLSRRDFLKRGVLGAAGLAAVPAGLASLPALVAACNATPPAASPLGSAGLTGRLRVGTVFTDDSQDTRLHAADLDGLREVNAAFAAEKGLTPALTDTILGPDFKGPYLTLDPDDVCTCPWIAGYRMRYYAERGFIAPIDDVWEGVKGNFSAAMAAAVTGQDGRVYGIPVDASPWVMVYRKSFWASKGYAVPATWTDLLALCGRMRSDGLTPIALGAKDGWPPVGTFDTLNLRLNGYQFHIDLLAGKEKWTDGRVVAVFEAWRTLAPHYYLHYGAGDAFALQAIEDAAGYLVNKQAGMFYLPLLETGVLTAVDNSVLDDIDFFEFPYFGNEWDAEKAVEAPLDAWCVPARSKSLTADLAAAHAYLGFWSRGSTQLLRFKHRPRYFPTARDTDTSTLGRLGEKAYELMAGAGAITQSFDRDSRPDFAGAGGIESFLIYFLRDPALDLPAMTSRIQAFWDALPPYDGTGTELG